MRRNCAALASYRSKSAGAPGSILFLTAVETGHQQGRESEIGIGCGVGAAELDALAALTL